MFDILVGIHDALKDKSTNRDFKLSVVERGWFLGIDEFLNKIDAPMKNKSFFSCVLKTRFALLYLFYELLTF